MTTLSRKNFLRFAAAGLGAYASGAWLSGCNAPPATPTTTPIRPTIEPTPTIHLRRPEVIKMYPNTPSQVVRASHTGAWDGKQLSLQVLNQMLDASITQLTGLNDAKQAWLSLFSPDERIALKVNSITTGITHVPLVLAVADRLQAVGVPAENIVIYDRYVYELKDAGYTLNLDGSGVRCAATNGGYKSGWKLLGDPICLSRLLLKCNAVINIPILKAGYGMGISFALKNHYGTFDAPENFHRNYEQCIPDLNALQPIRDRTRLVIGDLLTKQSSYDSMGFRCIGTGDSILMSYDSVAHDAVGLLFADNFLSLLGEDPTAIVEQAKPWLTYGSQIGLGAHKAEDMKLVNVKLA